MKLDFNQRSLPRSPLIHSSRTRHRREVARRVTADLNNRNVAVGEVVINHQRRRWARHYGAADECTDGDEEYAASEDVDTPKKSPRPSGRWEKTKE